MSLGIDKRPPTSECKQQETSRGVNSELAWVGLWVDHHHPPDHHLPVGLVDIIGTRDEWNLNVWEAIMGKKKKEQ